MASCLLAQLANRVPLIVLKSCLLLLSCIVSFKNICQIYYTCPSTTAPPFLNRYSKEKNKGIANSLPSTLEQLLVTNSIMPLNITCPLSMAHGPGGERGHDGLPGPLCDETHGKYLREFKNKF